MANITTQQIETLKPYSEKLMRANTGQRVILSSTEVRALQTIYANVFGKPVRLNSCCGSGRTVAQRLSPLAKLYFETINTSKIEPLIEAIIEEAAIEVVNEEIPEVIQPEPKKRGRKAKVETAS